MDLDALLLSRLQFAFTIAFHILFPAFTIGLAAFLAVLGPGLLAGLSDDDPAGIATYSKLGADHGYRLLWIIPVSTLLLVFFHVVAVQIGVASGSRTVESLTWRMESGV